MNKAILTYEMVNAGLNKEKLRMRLGLSRSAFYRKREGITEFTESELTKLADIFDCSVDYLIGRVKRGR